MDHIPKPFSSYSHIEVPYLYDESCPYIYDNAKAAFGTYPERCGWKKDCLRDRGDITRGGSKTLKQIVSFWQSWLYFGFMHSVFDVPIRTEDFICLNDRDQRIITTRCLPQYLLRWSEEVSRLSNHERHPYIASLDRTLSAMSAYFKKCAMEDSPLPAEVVLSIVILHRTIVCFKLILFPASININEWWAGKAAALLDSQMYANGWCKSDVFMLKQRVSSLGIYFSNSLGPRLDNRDHSSCTNTICARLQNDEIQYETQHIELECKCKHLHIDSQLLSSIIQKEAVPLVMFSSDAGRGVSEINIVESNWNTPFVAISHVWADGLGNKDHNSLPRCQLSLLRDRIDALFKGESKIQGPLAEHSIRLFWIDALCVPVRPEYKRERRLAIASLNKIYRRADKVLVLNAELGKFSCNVSDQELSIRITSAPWWRRLWTFPEGVFANELWFQFAGGAIDVKSLMDKTRMIASAFNSGNWNAADQISHEGVDCLYRLYSFKAEPPVNRIRKIFEYVNWRSTSKESDEALCLGNLLDLHLPTLLNAPRNQRMQTFILTQKKFPSISLFIPEHLDRMKEEGFRWAPKSFAFRHGSIANYQFQVKWGDSDPGEELAEADKRGLHGKYFGFRISISESPQDKSMPLFLDESDSCWYIINLTMGDGFSWKDADPHKMLDPALILPRPPSLQDTAFVGLLVSIYREENEKLFATYVGTVAGSLPRQGGTEDEVRAHLNMRSLSGIRSARFKKLGIHQEWCIG
jgi:hypothetical protein